MATAVQRAWPGEMLERDSELAREYGVRIIANTVTSFPGGIAPWRMYTPGGAPGIDLVSGVFYLDTKKRSYGTHRTCFTPP